MAKLGTEKKPIIVRVQTEERGRYVAEQCDRHGWQYIIGLETDKPEDISDLEKALYPPLPAQSEKFGRNDPCPCGSGKKYKKCCGISGAFDAWPQPYPAFERDSPEAGESLNFTLAD